MLNKILKYSWYLSLMLFMYGIWLWVDVYYFDGGGFFEWLTLCQRRLGMQYMLWGFIVSFIMTGVFVVLSNRKKKKEKEENVLDVDKK